MSETGPKPISTVSITHSCGHPGRVRDAYAKYASEKPCAQCRVVAASQYETEHNLPALVSDGRETDYARLIRHAYLMELDTKIEAQQNPELRDQMLKHRGWVVTQTRARAIIDQLSRKTSGFKNMKRAPIGSTVVMDRKGNQGSFPKKGCIFAFCQECGNRIVTGKVSYHRRTRLVCTCGAPLLPSESAQRRDSSLACIDRRKKALTGRCVVCNAVLSSSNKGRRFCYAHDWIRAKLQLSQSKIIRDWSEVKTKQLDPGTFQITAKVRFFHGREWHPVKCVVNK